MLCIVHLNMNSVSCPGVRFSPKSMGKSSYLSIQLFGHKIFTKSVNPLFPCVFNESFKISKVVPNCNDPSGINKWLKESKVYVKLLQTHDDVGKIVLAVYEAFAWDLLFPTITSTFSQKIDRQIFLQPTAYFPGPMLPCLHFTSRTCICESLASDTIQDYATNLSAIDRMLSCKGKICDHHLMKMGASSFSAYKKQPFVVRKADQDLLSKTPPIPVNKIPKSILVNSKVKSNLLHNSTSQLPTKQYMETNRDDCYNQYKPEKVSTGTQWESPIEFHDHYLDYLKKYYPTYTPYYHLRSRLLPDYDSYNSPYSVLTPAHYDYLDHWRKRFGLDPGLTLRKAYTMLHIPADTAVSHYGQNKP